MTNNNHRNYNHNNSEATKLVTPQTEIKPIGNLYKVYTSEVREFINSFLEANGISGVNAVVNINKEGSNSQIGVDAVLVLDKNSKHVQSNDRNIANVAACVQGVVKKSGIKPTPELTQCLVKMTKHEVNGGNITFPMKVSKSDKKTYVFFDLDIFKILSLMLDAQFHKWNIRIIETMNTKNDGILAITKTMRQGNANNNTGLNSRIATEALNAFRKR